MVAGLDERSRRMMEEPRQQTRADRDLTELERELEASFIADLDSQPRRNQDRGARTGVGAHGADAARCRRGATSRFKPREFSDIHDADKVDIDSTSKLRGHQCPTASIWIWTVWRPRSAAATPCDQPRAAEELFSTEVFEASQRSRRVDLDVGEAMNGSEHPDEQVRRLRPTSSSRSTVPLSELEPVTMSEVGTKLDLARAYMDMGDPEGARSILEEVVQEGSASQKQEASRLIESLPG